MIKNRFIPAPASECIESWPISRRAGWQTLLRLILIILGLGWGGETSSASLVTLLSSDASGTTSFTGATNWSNGQAPSAANDYFVPKSLTNPTVDYVIRTPSTAVHFAGNSLTVEGYVAFKATNLLTVDDLRLTNGLVGNYSSGGNPAVGRLAGHLNIITNGVIYAGNGATLEMQILSIITGSGALEIREPSTVILSATNTYNGPVTLTGSTLIVDGTGSLTPSSLILQNYTSGTTRYPYSTNVVLPGGNLNVGSGPSGVLRVGYRTSGAGSTNSLGVLNVAAQSTFNVNVGEFSVGNNITSLSNLFAVGYVYLATNNFVTATNIFIGDNAVSGSSGVTSAMTLGGGTNYFNTPWMQVSLRKESGSVSLPAGGVFRLDNGVTPAELSVGMENLGTSVSPTGTMDLSGGTFLASLDALTIGQKSGGSSGNDTGVLTLGSAANNVTANTVVIGSMAGATNGSPLARGTLTFGGGSFLVNGNVTLGAYDGSGFGSATGTLNVNGGTFSVAGNLVDGGGTATLNLKGGTVDLQPAGASTPGNVSLDILSGAGTITNAATVTVSTSVTVGATNITGVLSVSSLDVSSGAALNFNLSGTNNFLQVNGNLTLNNNTVNVTTLSSLATGTYHLINYTGTLGGNTSLTLNAPTTRQTFALDLSTAGQVNLVVTGNAISLLWSGDGTANVWDIGTTANWDDHADVYYDGDFINFDDTGSAVPDINVAAPVQPGSMTVSNTVEAYIFDGSPISTTGVLTKKGGNLLALANDGNNFSGPIDIEAGTLAIGNGAATGSLGTGPITNNGELLLNKSSGGAAVNSAISGAGTVQLMGAASLTLGGSNSYTGVTTIGSGCQLNLLNNNALGSTNGDTVVQAGGSVRITTAGNWTVPEPVEINGYGIVGSAGALYANTTSNNVTWTGPVTVDSPAQIRDVNTGVRLTLAGPVTANEQTLEASANDSSCLLAFQNTLSLGTDPTLGALTTDGAGTVKLGGTTNIAGSTTVNAGTLLITTPVPPQIGNVIVNAGTLQIGSGAGDGSLPTGQINLAASTTKLVIDSTNQVVLANSLLGSGTLSILNYSTLVINNANPSFTGNVTTGNGVPTIGGVISLSNSQGLGNGSASQTVSLTHASLQLQGGLDIPAGISFLTSGGTLSSDIAAGLIPIHSLSGDNIIEGSITLNSGDGDSVISVDSGTLTLNGFIQENTAGRTLVLGGAGTGILNGYFYDSGGFVPALTKQDAGTWTITMEEDYPGLTTVSGGTLILGASASLPYTAGLKLVNGATLDVSGLGGFSLSGSQPLSGNGNINGSLTAYGAVNPGPLGTLNVTGSLVLTASTTMELNRTNVQNADLISAANLTFGGALTITNVGPALQAGDRFNLFDGPINGSFSVTNLPTLAATNLYWDLSQFGSQGILAVGSTSATSPTMLPPTVSGNNLVMQVVSQTGYNYVLQGTASLAPTAWTNIQTNAGGGTLTFTIPLTSGNPQQFFRISVQ